MGKSVFTAKYRVRNWTVYNRALVRRANLALWIDEQAVESWRDASGSGARGGRPRIYTDTAIECALVVKAVFHLSLRATQGFLESVVRLMRVELPVPDYTTVSRRQVGLDLKPGPAPACEPHHVVTDVTGLKVFGAGEWYVRKHGRGRGGAEPGGNCISAWTRRRKISWRSSRVLNRMASLGMLRSERIRLG